jgi:CBS domain-containing protein
MSPRAAWRLETLGFEQAYDYVGGKADWVANGLHLEGAETPPLYAGELADPDPPMCGLDSSVGEVRAALDRSRAGFCIVVNEHRVVLGRVRRSVIQEADPAASAESVMEPGPSTVRYDTVAADLVRRLAQRELRTAIVTTPGGRLVGVFTEPMPRLAFARRRSSPRR